MIHVGVLNNGQYAAYHKISLESMYLGSEKNMEDCVIGDGTIWRNQVKNFI